MIAVRAGTPADFPAIEALWQRLCEEDRRHGLQGSHSADAPAQWVDSFRTHLGRFAFLHVAHGAAGAGLLGFVLARLSVQPIWLGGALVGELSSLYVDPAARGQAGSNVAQRLVRHAESALRRAGAESLQVRIQSANTRSVDFFRKLAYIDSTYTLVKTGLDESAPPVDET